VPQGEYEKRMDALVDKVHAAPTAHGLTDVQMPGEPETRHEALRRRAGIPYSRGEIAKLQQEAAAAASRRSPCPTSRSITTARSRNHIMR
jgi:LDH2 family malate/lactate/ureidoglycolate dehydrogenase